MSGVVWRKDTVQQSLAIAIVTIFNDFLERIAVALFLHIHLLKFMP